jgi:bacterioferritin-associated ferredoxin
VIVCHCHQVSERTIREAVQDGAHTRRQVTRACRAGGACGGCRPTIRAIIDGEAATEPLLVTSPSIAAAAS